LRIVEKAELQTLSGDELRLAIESFGDADWIRLNKIAQILAYGRQVTWQDLLQEAMCRALSGVRRCPRDVAPAVFLGNAMWSIASASDKERRHDPLQLAESIHVGEEDDEPHPAMEIEDPIGSPEDFVIDDFFVRGGKNILDHRICNPVQFIPIVPRLASHYRPPVDSCFSM
jgi:hypothetical protein